MYLSLPPASLPLLLSLLLLVSPSQPLSPTVHTSSPPPPNRHHFALPAPSVPVPVRKSYCPLPRNYPRYLIRLDASHCASRADLQPYWTTPFGGALDPCVEIVSGDLRTGAQHLTLPASYDVTLTIRHIRTRHLGRALHIHTVSRVPSTSFGAASQRHLNRADPQPCHAVPRDADCSLPLYRMAFHPPPASPSGRNGTVPRPAVWGGRRDVQAWTCASAAPEQTGTETTGRGIVSAQTTAVLVPAGPSPDGRRTRTERHVLLSVQFCPPPGVGQQAAAGWCE